LTPLAAAVRDLVLKKFEGIEAEFMLWDLESFFEDVGRFVLYKKEVPVGFIFADLLHDAEVIDGGEEVAPREIGFGLFG
jgi:hypothetical protein